HGHTILGRVFVASPSERTRIGRALIEGNRRTGPNFKCFDPYIGVAAGRGGGGTALAAWFWWGDVEVICSGPFPPIFSFSGWPARPLARQLAAAGIALPPPPDWHTGS